MSIHILFQGSNFLIYQFKTPVQGSIFLTGDLSKVIKPVIIKKYESEYRDKSLLIALIGFFKLSRT